MVSSLDVLPRQVIAVLLALKNCPHGATFVGVKTLLGLGTESGARQAVRAAKQLQLVRVVHTPDGRGAKAVVSLTRHARTLFRRAGLSPEGSAA